MKKVFSNWFLDIGKYIVTALVLSSAFSDKLSEWFYYTACFVLVTVIVLIGIFLHKSYEKDEEKKLRNSNQQNP